MHAHSAFAVALVGIAAFFFFAGARSLSVWRAGIHLHPVPVAVLIVFTILLTRRVLEKLAIHWAARSCGRCVWRLDLVDSKRRNRLP